VSTQVLEDDDPSFTIYLETLKIDPNTIFVNHFRAYRPLYYTIRNENYFATEMLLQYGADPNLYVDGSLWESGTHYTALVEAMLHTHNVGLVDLLVKYGADMHQDFAGMPVFMQAFMNVQDDSLATIEYVLRARIVPVPYFRAQRLASQWWNEESPVIATLLKLYIPWRWKLLFACVKLLSLHKRATVTANHPLRKLERGEFEEEE